MKEYALTQWILLFFLFSCFGWLFESAYVSLRTRRLTNRGFLTGPWIPLYGAGGVVMLFIALPFYQHAALVFLVGVLGATALEYVTGIVMEAIFRVRYWQYRFCASKNGYIALPSSLCWGVFTLILTYRGTPWIDTWIYRIPTSVELLLALVLNLLFWSDAVNAFRTAFQIRDTAQLLSLIQKEMEELREKLPEGAEAFAAALPPHMQTALQHGKEQLSAGREQLRAAKETLESKKAALESRHDAQLAKLYQRYEELHARREKLLSRLNWFARQTIKGNPSASSALAGFEQIKKRVESLSDELSDKLSDLL